MTAVGRDGGLEGPDLELLERVVGLGTGRVIASGGIRSIEDLLAARRLGCVGAIVGRALYEGRLDLGGRGGHAAGSSDRLTGPAIRPAPPAPDRDAATGAAAPPTPQCAAVSTALRCWSMTFSATWLGTSS